MIELYEVFILIGYYVGVAGIVWLIGRKVGRAKDLEKEFDGLYFLRWAFGTAALAQLGLVVIVCALFWKRQALAVGITTLIGMPGLAVVVIVLQIVFFRRYNSLRNLLRRLERLGPADRAVLLESLPPETYAQVPGDYRIVSWEEEPKRKG